MPEILTNPPKALLFDVFGTCTNWRSTVPAHLSARARTSNPTLAGTIPATTWTHLTQDWRGAYANFVLSFEPSITPWKDIDTLHHEALISLLSKYDLTDLWTPEEVKDISLVWHKLDGWPDSTSGLRALSDLGIKTASMSNGNMALLTDLAAHAGLPFTKILSAENARTEDGEHVYKPHLATYLYGCRELGVEVGECALVAAHIGELEIVKEKLGMRVVYVERPDEEGWTREGVLKAKEEGWVDMWIGLEEEGLEEVARRLGGGR
ncbi:MAG: hypothetical protein MMC23_008428 [Stictis urceolatum]|nr:hypothetical protein [Stictis urceolata]